MKSRLLVAAVGIPLLLVILLACPKIVTALAYLRQYGSFDDFYYECTGTYENAGFTIPIFVNRAFLAMSFWLWLMGIIYNVRPIRTKDIPVIDVLSESVNTAIRLLMGWFIVSAVTLPPSTLMLG